MATPRLSCRDLVELVTEYLEGALPAGARARFEAHLAACPPCVIYLEQMRHTLASLGALREANLDAGARDALLAAFRDWKRA